ncbi:hypothetical protein RI578_40605 (plasmid) [Streptomyces sp. BB1-1-1]|uniref:hypothetical protein n=1 Tax=Streptomyces sp. BB1-1-1 TaxID=3074430 RepID=UPI0028781245|nr:hypothetical protein [Streptomyces sp. BB1-1-1]WND40596.1 hypothetical protein RI578_40605 [Streptomyces sp. BB1-1-1]
MSTTPSTRGRTSRAHSRTPDNEPPQTPETDSDTPDDETQLRRLLTRIGVRPLGHAEQPIEEEPEPGAARPDHALDSAGATRRISMSPGGRLPVPGQTIDLTDLQQQAPADGPMPAENQDATPDPAGPSESQSTGEQAKSAWPPRISRRRRKGDDQAEDPAAADAEGDGPDWFRVRKSADPQASDPDTYEVHNHYYGTGQEPSASAGERTGPGRNRSSLTAWWASLTPLQRFILHNGSAATAGAWSWGVFTAQWDAGLPQWTLAVMHDAAASSNEPSTPFIVGGGVILLAAVVGGGISAFVERWLYRLPSFCAAVRFLTHIPVASAGIAVLLFLPSTF